MAANCWVVPAGIDALLGLIVIDRSTTCPLPPPVSVELDFPLLPQLIRRGKKNIRPKTAINLRIVFTSDNMGSEDYTTALGLV
jgi:hypothetical protein